MTPTHQKKWGIIGDGQLARMLALAAYPLGIRPVLLTNDANSSAGQVCPLQVRGSVNARTDLHALLSQVDFAIIESEFVNCDALEATGLANKVIPGIKAIRALQDKIQQKKLLKSLDISSSIFYEPQENNARWLDQILASNQPAMVLKFATLGYDGKGVCVLGHNAGDRQKAETFCELAADRKIQVFAEEKVDFTREVAMVAARSINGSFSAYPLMISEQVDGICYRVEGPAVELGVDQSFEKLARTWCERIAEATQLVGTFAVEFFISRGGRLLVNEIAPRVHNSGHYTQNAGCVSQFENHWRAATGLTMGDCRPSGFFAMQNLLGPKDLFSKDNAPPPEVGTLGFTHWYGKSGISPGRKMGHVNAHTTSFSDKELALRQLSESLKNWESATKSRLPFTPMELLK